MVDQEGADVLEEVETTYANAGRTGVRVSQGPVDDERMPEEWNRARNTEGGEVVGFIGQRAIVRAGGGEGDEIREESERGGEEDARGGAGEDGVMAALARLRQQ